MIVNKNPIDAELSVATEQAQELDVNNTKPVEMAVDADGSVLFGVQHSKPIPMTLSMEYRGGGGSIDAVWGEITGDIEDQTDLQEELAGKYDYTDLGNIDLDPYDYDIWAYIDANPLTESGHYIAHEIADDFDYYIIVERAGDCIYQEYWYTEEGSQSRYIRTGRYEDNEWVYDTYTSPVYQEQMSNYYPKWQTYTKQETYNLLSSKVDTTTLQNNYYDKDTVDEMFEGFSPENMIETTWARLVSLRDSGQLVKGAYYRITDYNFVTTKLGAMSGNHQFDIVLLAISESMLSENGYACKHAGDHYFEREVTEGGIEWLYTLYVDDYGENYGDEPMDHQDDLHSSDEFCDSGVLPHPETDEDVPVLYKTDTGEYDFDDPDYDDAFFYEGTYELDGDEYDLWAKYEQHDGEWVFMMQYALTPIVVEDGELIVSPIPETKIVPVNMNAWELKYCLDNDKDLFDWAETDGKGVIYWLKDEFGNEAPYDFKNVMFRRYQVSSASYSVLNGLRNLYLYLDGCFGLSRNNNNKYWYTFASADGITDGSLFGECTYNTIQPYIYLSPKGKNIKGLNNIVLQNANRNELGYNCFDITLLNNISNNKFYYCHDICGQSFNGNEILANCYGLTFDRCSNSHFGDGTKSSCGKSAEADKTGSGCMNINFGDNCVGMELGNSCNNISFGQWCYNNIIGSGSNNITMGNYCSYINIGKMCLYITFTNYYRYVDIEDNVSKLTFTTTGGSTTYYVQYVKVCRGVNNKSLAPTRRQNYEQNYYTTGRTETAV